ncbi:efflux RND transporter periplasmic adaptor subunit [Sulfurimonas crateris]|uniref:Efflux RND transporter periplasmic adaptor subunit n=1 Tax=Sulfurimonas crateris TaxID=2574727 RepID=A0A4U2Z676_9BACT|nr:efflux RND transporter periplasmic adaptor subunit [Sulfurimonas crateris]TKI69727.1 efflux RND transporter periplasmic adaptor subunit [Sulfurimonas crateris]
MIKILFGVLFSLLSLNAQDVYANFFVEPLKDAALAFHAGGIVKEVRAEVSSSVKKGDLLAVLANDDIKALLDVAKAELANAEVEYKYAARDYERQQKVRHLIDEARFDIYALAYEKSKTALELAKANLTYREALYKKSMLYAPFEGVVYEKSVEIGDVVTEMAPKVVLKLQSRVERKLVLEFDQKYWQDVKIGQSFRYKVDGDEKEHRGVITKLYPHVDKQSRKLHAEVEVKGFAAGLFGDGYIETKK